MDIKALYFGYQISKQTFSVLWKQEDVSVRFDLRKRKWFFFLSHLSEAYKLEISYDSIRQIMLHRPPGQATKFLLIQVSNNISVLVTFTCYLYQSNDDLALVFLTFHN
jgi:RNA-dependent RNA polymerase